MTTVLEHSDQFSSMRLIGFREEGHTLSLPPCSACSTDTMDVIFDGERESLIHDQLDLWDVQSSSSNI